VSELQARLSKAEAALAEAKSSQKIKEAAKHMAKVREYLHVSYKGYGQGG